MCMITIRSFGHPFGLVTHSPRRLRLVFTIHLAGNHELTLMRIGFGHLKINAIPFRLTLLRCRVRLQHNDRIDL